MIRRSLAFVLAGFVLYAGAQAQTPAPAPKIEGHSFSMFFDGDGGYLGVQTAEVTKDNFTKYGLKEVRGVAVEKVVEGSPAEKAGIQVGDVIVRFNNDEVTSVRKLTRLLGEVSPDHQAKVTVIRSGSERELTATVGKRPMPKFDEGAFTWTAPHGQFPPLPDFHKMPKIDAMPKFEQFPPVAPEHFVFRAGSGRRIGVGVTTLTKQLSDHFGVTSGVMINEVRPDSAAAKAGLKAGDIIVEVEGKEVKGEGDLIRAIHEKKEGDVSLTIIRDRNRQVIRVTPEKVEGGFDSFHFPNAPDVPAFENFKLAVPATPVPMNEFKFPGRIL